MLPYYSPLKVAEQFMMLEALFPEPHRSRRGTRAPAATCAPRRRSLPATTTAANSSRSKWPIWWDLMHGTLPAHAHRARRAVATASADAPATCGCSAPSEFGGLLAAQLGIRFAFAHFINAHFGHRVARAYRERFGGESGNAATYLAAAPSS